MPLEVSPIFDSTETFLTTPQINLCPDHVILGNSLTLIVFPSELILPHFKACICSNRRPKTWAIYKFGLNLRKLSSVSILRHFLVKDCPRDWHLSSVYEKILIWASTVQALTNNLVQPKRWMCKCLSERNLHCKVKAFSYHKYLNIKLINKSRLF